MTLTITEEFDRLLTAYAAYFNYAASRAVERQLAQASPYPAADHLASW